MIHIRRIARIFKCRDRRLDLFAYLRPPCCVLFQASMSLTFIPNGVRDASMELDVTLLVLVTECTLCCVSSEKLCYLWPALYQPG